MGNKKNFFIHESSYLDQDVSVGKNTKIWHFSHIQSNASIGENCSIGQNVNVANNVKIGNGVKLEYHQYMRVLKVKTLFLDHQWFSML